MSRSLEAVLESARERAVPWDAQREQGVARKIDARRQRSALSAPLARWTLGGLGSAALCASVLQVSQLIREREPAEERFEWGVPSALEAAREAEEWPAERPVGDGGFDGAAGS
jgi:hypothetical protein